MADLAELIQLKLYETKAVVPLRTFSPGTYTQRLYTAGNSMLASLFVESVDVGATVQVNYFDYGIGPDLGERYELDAHTLITAPTIPEPDRLLVTNMHDKPVIEIIVTGGTVRAGIYLTIVSSFASDLDSNLHRDGDTVDIARDKGLPPVCYDEANGLWRFLRCDENGLKISGDVNITATEINQREYGVQSLTYGSTATLISYSPLAGEKTRLHNILVAGDGSGDFTVKINSIPWGTLRTSWNDRQVLLPLNGLLIDENDTITIEAENTTPAQSGICEYEAFLYRGPE